MKITKAELKRKNEANQERIAKQIEDREVAKLRNNTVYNNYLRGMKEVNKKRAKSGLKAIPVRNLKEWLGD